MSKKTKRVPKQFQRALWSYNINKMDLVKDKKEIISQVLNHGSWEDLKILYKIYKEREIKDIIKNPRRGVWFDKVLNFWTTMLNVKLKKDVREKAVFR